MSVTITPVAGASEVEISLDADGDLRFDLYYWERDFTNFYVRADDVVKALQKLGVLPYNMDKQTLPFFDAVADFLRARNYTVEEVIDVEQEDRDVGGCETCAYSYTVVEITFRDGDGYRETYVYEGDMGELIRELTD